MKKNITTFVFTLLVIVLFSCSSDNDSPEENVDCSSFSIEVSLWTNNYNAKVNQSGGIHPVTYLWSNGETSSTIGGSEGTLEVGTYSVTATDGNGCTETGSVTVINELAVLENSLNCINDTQAYIYVHITDDGQSEIIEGGVCYALSQNPDVDDIKVISEGSYSLFTIELSPLNPATTYYARGYVINAGGISYGEQISFTTNANPSPFTIGQSYQGGIIGGISCDGQHGFIVANNNFTGSWSTVNELCDGVVYNGYDDWHLPSYRELRTMRENLYLQGLGNFHTGNTIYDNYWSSFHVSDNTQCGNYRSAYLDFDQNILDELSVCYHLYAKPIRYF